MRTLLTSTALVALMSVGAFAQDAAAPAAPAAAAPAATTSTLLTQGYKMVDTDGLASKLMGFPIYSSAANDAEKIGEINDLVIGHDGKVAAVVVGVGGFLGIGEKNVAVEYNQLQWTVAEDNSERLVLPTTKEALEAAVPVEMIEDQPMQTAAAPAAQPAADQVETGAITPDQNAMAPAAAGSMDRLNREGLVEFDEMTLTADQLLGTNVYAPNDDHIGTIGDLVLGENGSAIDAVVIDFGGFLGIGTKPVAVAFEDLQFYADKDGNNRSLVLNVTRDQMEAAPAFDRDTYAANRTTQRVVVSPLAATAG